MDTLPPETLDQLRAEIQRLRDRIATLEAREEPPVLTAGAPLEPPIWFDRVRDAIVVADSTWHIQDWNQAAAQLYGWSRAEVVGRSIREIITAVRYVSDDSAESALQTLRATGSWRGSLVQRARDGREVVVNGSACVLVDAQGVLTGYLVLYHDVTDHTRAEAALRTREAQYRQIVETTQEGIWVIDATATTTFVNAQMAAMLGYTVEEMIGVSLFAFLHPDDHAAVGQNVARRHSGITEQVERHFRHKRGTDLWTRLATNPLYDHTGAYTGALAMVANISARKQAEEALRTSAQRLQVLADASHAFAEAEADAQVVLERIAQISADALVAGCVIRLRADDGPWLDTVTAYDHDSTLLIAVADHVLRTRIPLDGPNPSAVAVRSGQALLMPTIDPEAVRATVAPEIWSAFVRVRVHSGMIAPLRAHGQILGVISFARYAPEQPVFTQDDLTLAQDLADRAAMAIHNTRLYRQAQAAQQAAAETLARLDALITSLPNGIGYLDWELRYQLVNPALAAINGRTPADHIGRTPADLLPGLAPRLEPIMRQVLTTGVAVRDLELHGQPCPQDAVAHDWLISYFPVPGPTGALSGVGVSITDITQCKRTAAALHASEARFRLLAEHAHDVIYRYSLTPTFTLEYLSPAIARLSGYPREAFYDDPELSLRLVYPDDLPIIQRMFSDATALPQPVIVRWQHQDGSTIWTEQHAWLVTDAANQPLAIEGIARDITARRQAEEALRTSQQNLTTLIENIDGAIWSVDAAYRLIVGNALFRHNVRAALGRDPLPGDCLVTLPLPQAALDEWRTAYDRALAGETFSVEAPTRFTADPHTVDYRFSPITSAAGAITGLTVFGRDTTERHRADRALHETERKLGTLFDLLPVGVSILDAMCAIVYVNPALEQIVQMDRADLFHKAHLARQYLRADGTPMPIDELASVQAIHDHQAVLNLETGIVIESGALIWVSVSAVPVDFPDWRVVVITTNITARKQAEVALRESEVRYRTLFETMAQGVVYHDTQGRAMMANPAALRILGLTPSQLLGHSFLESGWQAIHEDGTPFPGATHPAMVALATQQAVHEVVIGIAHPDLPGYRWLSIQAVPQFQPGATTPTQAYTIFEDITARWQAQQALVYERQQLDAIVRTMYEGVIAFHPDGMIVIINAAAVRFTGLEIDRTYTTLSEMGRAMSLRPYDAEGQALTPDAWPLNRILRGDPFVGFEVCLRPQGSSPERWLAFSGTPVYDAQDTLILGVVTAQDITQRKRDEAAVQAHAEALSRSNADLTRALRLKDEFLAMMSHELRTPLNVVLGITEALEEEIYGPISARQHQALADVMESGRHLLAILSDILDLAHIEAGKTTLDRFPIAVDDLCRSALQLVEAAAQQKGIRLRRSVEHGIAGLMADERRLTQILVNLLDNAVKFTPAGGSVGLDVAVGTEQDQLQFVVWDTGIGIAEADYARLFQPFTQVDGKLSRFYGGVGLGLTLVHRLVDLHGGSISLESTPGQSSRFTVSLPWADGENVAPVERHVAEPHRRAWISPPRVVIADDHEPTLALYRDLLTQEGCVVAVARTGTEAVAQVRATHPDVAILDIQMPEMDGLTALRRMRDDPSVAGLPIIALTGLAMPGDRERCLAAGANAYLAKPVGLRTLIATITRVLTSDSMGEEPIGG